MRPRFVKFVSNLPLVLRLVVIAVLIGPALYVYKDVAAAFLALAFIVYVLFAGRNPYSGRRKDQDRLY